MPGESSDTQETYERFLHRPKPRFDDEEPPRFDDPAFDAFWARGLIVDVLGVLKSGKEATVHLCAAHPDTGRSFFAAKRYRSMNERRFRDDAIYREGRWTPDARDRRAMKRKSDHGANVLFGTWMWHEYRVLRTLGDAAADVPAAIAAAEGTILMEFVGDEDGPAPLLKHVHPEPSEARALFDRLMWNVELFLSLHIVHADLSAFNVLHRDGRIWVIDLPQAVDARKNRHAPALLARDVGNLCRHFQRYGVHETPEVIVQDLWGRYVRGIL